MVFNSPCLTDKKELIHHEGTALLKWLSIHHGECPYWEPKDWLVLSKRLQFNKAMKTAHYMILEGVLMKNKDAASSRHIQLICAEFSSIQVKTQADWMYVVPTGRVVVPTGRYVVPASKVITGRVLSPGRVKIVIP
ncbi:hypothetical protein Tco_1357283 [Tanacetum coccineum]